MTTFNELGLKAEVLQGVHALGFTTPTPIQIQAIPQLLHGEKDFVGLAQTGTGKTAAFGLPMANLIDFSRNDVQAIILSPTRELGIQIGKDLENYTKFIPNAKITTVYGGASIDNQIKQLKRGTQIIVATPGRMVDILNRKIISLSNVKIAVLDEADEMLNMGFKDDLNSILDHTPTDKKVWLFSATMPNEVRRIAKDYMTDPFEITVGTQNSGNENIEHHYYVVDEKNRYYALKRVLDIYPDIYGLVFCRTKRETQLIAEKLIRDGYDADSLHGDLSQAQRDSVMLKFRNKNLQILVATDVAARGIDVDDITNVINYNLPDEIEVYNHRSGRTARAGKTGIACVFVNPSEVYKIKQIEKIIKRSFERLRVPEGREICEKQLFHLIENVKKQEVDTEEIEAYLPIVMEQLSEFDKEDLIIRFVASEFNRFLSYYKNSRDINASENSRNQRNNDSNPRNEQDANSNRVFINIGSKDGFNKGSFIHFICEKVTGVKGANIGRIDMMDSFSFFQIDKEQTNIVINTLSGMDLNGRTLRIEISGPRKSSGGGNKSGFKKRGDFSERKRFTERNETKSSRKQYNNDNQKTTRKKNRLFDSNGGFSY